MNWLDAPIILFLGLAAFIGSRKGMLKMLFPVAAVVLAIFLAGYLYSSSADYADSWLSSRSQSEIISFILVFSIVIGIAAILFLLASKILSKLVKNKTEFSGIVIPMAGIMSGIILAGFLYEPVAGWLTAWLKSLTQASVIAFAIIFIVSSIMITGLFQWLASMLDKPPYKSFKDTLNGLGGTILGLAIGGLVSGALLTIITKFYYESVETTMRGSALASFLLNNFPFVLRILPEEFNVVRHLLS